MDQYSDKVKKRIDKAYIMGRNERLTMPGKIAIVYSQRKEADEYMQYLEYLQSIGYIGEEIEDVQLEDLQGTSGLRALRADIIFEDMEEKAIQELLQTAVSMN